MNKNEPILIACEESGTVTEAFIKMGFTNVFSCDIMETSGNYPSRHIVGNVLPILNGNCCFVTSDGVSHKVQTEFSLIIAFPPCTHLAVSGARWFPEKRADGRQQQGIDFFMQFVNCKCNKVAIENPNGIMSTLYRKPDQILQPHWFGDPYQKATCIWLKGLVKLKPTNMVLGREQKCWKEPPGPNRSKIRSKTYQGIARAMTIWGTPEGWL